MSQYTIDHVKRMKHIKATLDSTATNEAALQQKQDMLDELLDIVDNIDYARGTSPAYQAIPPTLRSHAACSIP